jgi:hypothetical protein
MVRPLHVLAGALIVALLVPASGVAQVVKHSGSLLDVDADQGTIVLAELGPWRLDTETTVITVRTIVVTPDTDFALVRRVDPSNGFSGDFVVDDVEPWAIYPGDFVTVDCVHRGRRLVALRILVVEGVAP